MIKVKYLWIFFLVSLFLLSVGCSTKEERRDRHLKRARTYIEEGELKKAVIELKNVIQLDPNNDIACYELGETQLKLAQGGDAFRSFSQAVSINPDNFKAQLRLGQGFFANDLAKEAREKAEWILERSPDDIDALNLLSAIQALDRDIESAIKTLNQAVSINPDHFDTTLSLARLFVLNNDLSQAEKFYRKAISLTPTAYILYVELSSIYGGKKQWGKVEDTLKDMVQASDAKSQSLSILARFYESRENWDLVEKTYQKAVDFAPKEDVGPLLNLGRYYVSRKSYDKALSMMQLAVEIKKDDPNIYITMAQIYLNLDRIKDAEITVDKVLAEDNGHLEANLLKGKLYLLQKDFNNALNHFNIVLGSTPNHTEVFYYKALCLIGKNERRLAQQELLKAIELNPNLVEARLLLAEYYLHDGENTFAREQIETVLIQSPQHLKALMLQGELLTLEKSRYGAENAFNKVIRLDPNYALAYVKLGLLYSQNNQQEDAIQYFNKAIQLDPMQTDALKLIVEGLIGVKRYSKALEVCEELKPKINNSPSHLALIRYLEGTVFQAQSDYKMAKKQFEEAIKIHSNILIAHIALAKLHMQEKNPEEAITQYKIILEKDPNYLVGYMTLGTLYEQRGEENQAEVYYRKALKIKPDYALAANNLAWILIESGGNIDEALGFVQIAKEQATHDSNVMDTLGWIYYLKGSYLSAISELRNSLKQDPNNPYINYHLGMAYYKNDQPKNAREFLEKALAINGDFKGADEARDTLKHIKAS